MLFLITFFFSETINIERGVRQGSSLGPYLYSLQYELLANKVREDENIKGVTVCGKIRMNIGEMKITLFAADTQCYVSDPKSIDIWFQHLHTYERASGTVVNFNKSYGLLLGHEHLCDKIKWTERKTAALGVNYGIIINNTLFGFFFP